MKPYGLTDQLGRWAAGPYNGWRERARERAAMREEQRRNLLEGMKVALTIFDSKIYEAMFEEFAQFPRRRKRSNFPPREMSEMMAARDQLIKQMARVYALSTVPMVRYTANLARRRAVEKAEGKRCEGVTILEAINLGLVKLPRLTPTMPVNSNPELAQNRKPVNYPEK